MRQVCLLAVPILRYEGPRGSLSARRVPGWHLTPLTPMVCGKCLRPTSEVGDARGWCQEARQGWEAGPALLYYQHQGLTSKGPVLPPNPV